MRRPSATRAPEDVAVAQRARARRRSAAPPRAGGRGRRASRACAARAARVRAGAAGTAPRTRRRPARRGCSFTLKRPGGTSSRDLALAQVQRVLAVPGLAAPDERVAHALDLAAERLVARDEAQLDERLPLEGAAPPPGR